MFKEIAVIGGGIVGATTAFHLENLGHNIVLIDPELNQTIKTNNTLSGSKTSLGVLMGNTFRRSSGRGWRLRQRSMKLWPELIKKIKTPEIDLKLDTPLIQLASGSKEMELITKLSQERANLGIKLLESNLTMPKDRQWPNNQYGGLISSNDGRIDPIGLLQSLMIGLNKLQVSTINSKALSISCFSTLQEKKWKIILDNSAILKKDYVIICSALGTTELLKSIGYEYLIEAVLGQVIELVLEEDHKNWNNWPGVLVSNGINLIPQKNNELLIGATLEPGETPNIQQLYELKKLNGNAPEWLSNAHIKNHWYGLRAKPQKQAAPLLEVLEPGLILNTAHYRNGVLLAPACAEWVSEQI